MCDSSLFVLTGDGEFLIPSMSYAEMSFKQKYLMASRLLNERLGFLGPSTLYDFEFVWLDEANTTQMVLLGVVLDSIDILFRAWILSALRPLSVFCLCMIV